MRFLKFKVDGQRIRKDPSCNFSGLVSGTKGYLGAEFTFSKEWDDLAKAAVFKTGDLTNYVPIVNNFCSIPDEIAVGSRIEVSVVGKNTQTMLTTNAFVFRQAKGVV